MNDGLASYSGAMIAILSAAFGATLGFFGSYIILWLERRRQRRVARMRIAINLRRWINNILAQMWDVKTWDSSDGHAGNTYSDIPDFLFEESLEQVASVDYRTAMKIFKLIHKKDDANEEIRGDMEFGDDEDPINTWRGRSAQIWLKALRVYDRIAKQIGWSEHIISDENRKMMQEEIDDFNKRKKDRAKSQGELLKLET
jgi:hypothetical protein